MELDTRIRTVRLVAAVSLLAVISVFVWLYNSVQLNILIHGHKVDQSVLPAPCQWVRHLPWIGAVLTAGLIGLGLFALRRRQPRPLVFEIAVQAATLWAVISVLACLLIWWLPHTYPVGVIEG